MGSYKFGSVYQTQLGSLDGKHLAIIKPARGHKLSQEKTFILGLPTEALVEIFKYVVFENREWYTHMYTAAKRLTLVCHRFNDTVLPLFYQEIVIGVRGQTNLSLKKVHSVLRDKPWLRDYCKILSVNLAFRSRLTKDSVSMLNDLVSYLTKVRIFKISCGPKQSPRDTVEMIQIATQHMRQIETLTFLHYCNDFFSQDILKHISFPSLQSLAICTWGGKTRSRHVKMEPKMNRTGTFTSLLIDRYQEDPKGLEQLIHWPASLVHFKFPFHPLSFGYIDLSILGAWLSIHKDTLSSIEIGNLSHAGRGVLFDLSEFSKLEVLELSWPQLRGRFAWDMEMMLEFTHQDANFLLAPNLHTFRLRFGIHHEDHEGWDRFGELEETWVREFARAAIARKSKLRLIQICFYPPISSTLEEAEYPWGRMDRIHEEIEQHGLTLEYNKPCLTKELWLKCMDLKGVNCLSLWSEDDEDSDSDSDSSSRGGGDIRDYFEYHFP